MTQLSFASLDHRLFKASVLRYSTLFAIAIVPFGLILVLFGNIVVGTVYGEKYLGNGAVVAVLGVNLVVTAFRFSFSRALFVMNRAKSDFLINAATLCIMMTIGIWCVIKFGPLGVAVGILVGNVAASILKFLVFEAVPATVDAETTI